MTPWPAKDIEYLRRWWGVIPASRIGETLGRTKHSCIGQAHRLGLPNLGNPVGKPKFDPLPEPRKAYGRRNKPKAPQKPVETPKPIAPVIAKPVPKPAPAPPQLLQGRIRLIDAMSRQCRWLTGDGRGADAICCGAKTTGKSAYCERHRAIVGKVVK